MKSLNARNAMSGSQQISLDGAIALMFTRAVAIVRGARNAKSSLLLPTRKNIGEELKSIGILRLTNEAKLMHVSSDNSALRLNGLNLIRLARFAGDRVATMAARFILTMTTDAAMESIHVVSACAEFFAKNVIICSAELVTA